MSSLVKIRAATTNRFLTPDTIVPVPANPQSWNRYSYVNNNPINYNDPTGHCNEIAQPTPDGGTHTIYDCGKDGELLTEYVNSAGSDEYYYDQPYQRLVATHIEALLGMLALDRGFTHEQVFAMAVGHADAQVALHNGDALRAYAEHELLVNTVDFLVGGTLGFGSGYFNRKMNAKASSTRSMLQGFADEADAVIPGRGAVVGTRKHSHFKANIDALKNPDLRTGVNYQQGIAISNNAAGSVRLDVVEGPLLNPRAVYDLKTGSAKLTSKRIAQIRSHLPNQGQLPNGEYIPIIGIYPGQ